MKMELLQQIVNNTGDIGAVKILLIIGLIMLLIMMAALWGVFDYVKAGRTKDEFRFDVREVLDETIQEKIRQLSIEHAELYKLRQWTSELSEEKLDVEALGEETVARVKALAIKMAEEELERALADRDQIDRERSRLQRDLIEKAEDKAAVEECKNKIGVLSKHYKHVTARVKTAEERLNELTSIQ